MCVLDPYSYSLFLRFWELKTTLKDQSVSKQVIAVLKEVEKKATMSFFVTNPKEEIILLLNKLNGTPDANNIASIKSILIGNNKIVPVDKFDFLMKYILNNEEDNRKKPLLNQEEQTKYVP